MSAPARGPFPCARSLLFCAALLSAPSALAEPDDLLQEIQTHFHATRKWFGMVSDLRLERAPDGSLSPHYEALHSKFVLHHDAAGQTLSPRLPSGAAGSLVVQFDGVPEFWVRTREVGVSNVPAEIRKGLVVYPGAVAGGDLIYKLTPTHVDEYVYFRAPPSHLKREIEFDTGASVFALREAGSMIEVIGKDGVARLRLSAPLARGGDGTRRRGTVRVDGRKVIEEVDLTGLVTPVLVDPDWSTTGSMTQAHWGDVAWRRPDARVQAVGGCALIGCPTSFAQTNCSQVLASTDVWDPSSGTWTSGPPMATARYLFAGTPLPSGDLLVAGGCTATGCAAVTALAERFSVSMNMWLGAGSLGSPRANAMAASIAGGDVVLAGGCDPASCTSDVELWTEASNAWVSVAPLPAPWGFGTATSLADGRMLVVGGCADSACTSVLAEAAVYDPVKNAWTLAGTLSAPRAGHSATLLDDGTVLVAGGCADVACSSVLSSAEVWVGNAQGGGSFQAAPPMMGGRHHHTATLLASGEVLMAGGADSSGSSTPSSEVYLPRAKEWIATSAMLMSRAYHVGVALADGNVLVAGGCNPQTCIPFAEIFSPASLPPDTDAGVDASAPAMDSGPGVDAAGGMDGGAPGGGPAPSARSPHPALYRTDVVTCATDTTQDLSCPVAGWELEDGDFQPNSRTWNPTATGELFDPVTGLTWQATDDGSTYDQPSAVQHCASLSTQAAGPGSWRLPSVVELMTLVDYGVVLPAIDPGFAGTQGTNYWTATPAAGSTMLAWTVKFDAGEVIPLLEDTTLPVRCVRGESTVLNAAGNGLRIAGPLRAQGSTVRDEATRLEWQRSDDGTKRTWKDALSYCSRLTLAGESGWHLPNVAELAGLVQYDGPHNGVTIDPAFQNAHPDLYWTSSQNEGAPTLSWSVTFNLGVIDGVTVSAFGYARCVRHLDEAPLAAPVSASGSACVCASAGRHGADGGAPAMAIALGASTGLWARRRRRQARRSGR